MAGQWQGRRRTSRQTAWLGTLIGVLGAWLAMGAQPLWAQTPQVQGSAQSVEAAPPAGEPPPPAAAATSPASAAQVQALPAPDAAPAAGQAPPTAPAAPPPAAAQPPAPATAPPPAPAVVGAAPPAQPAQAQPPARDPRPSLAELQRYRIRELPYSGGPAPDGYQLRSRPRWGLIVSGAAMFVVSYAASVSFYVRLEAEVDLEENRDALRSLLIPLVGPWLTFTQFECSDGDDSCDEKTVAQVLAALDGVVQGAGALLATIGALTPRRSWIRNDLAAGLRVLPTSLGGQGAGVLLRGTF